MSVQPFTVNVGQATLDDLQDRLARTRWTAQVEGADWDYGVNIEYLETLCEYWRDQFDWRAQEAMLNQFAHHRAEIDGFGLHFIHERGVGPEPLPLLLLHGWPDSFFRFSKIIPLLTDPARFGGDAADAFDVVVPSLPGYGFSDQPRTRDFTAATAVQMIGALMKDELGYARYGAHGGDIGSGFAEMLAGMAAASLIGIHLTDVPYWHLFTVGEEDLSEAEQQYLAAGKAWQMQEGAYAMLQSTKPSSLAQGLNDSPSGLAAWIVEKFRAWSDCDGDVERRFTKDELLTNIMIYWATGTIGSSFLPYYDQGSSGTDGEGESDQGGADGEGEPAQGGQARIETPTGVAIFPKDLVPAPREFGERFFNIRRWTEMPRGGHFAALEEPELLVEEIRAFYRELR